MKFTVQALLTRGFSQRQIAKELSISRKTVRKYKEEIDNNSILTPQIDRYKKLDPYHEEIKEWISMGKTGVLIRENLATKHGVQVGYSTISRYLQQFKTSEVYIPLIIPPGEEGQVDFGYIGRFDKDGKLVKVWSFSMILSNSRYSYHKIVTDQSVNTFIKCHIEAFEYFGGSPKTVKLDNLKAGVISPSFYEPTIQRQYAEFLHHYNSVPITARIRRGQDKGKVEAGVKYVKNNFLKRIQHQDYYQLEKDLLDWTNNICNKRIHGTIKKVPVEVFYSIEKPKLSPLPMARYEIFKIEHRKVNNYGHICFNNNFYSVPSKFICKTLIVKSTGTILKIYDDTQEVAVHPVCSENGKFISIPEHRPLEKQGKTEQEYIQRAKDFGIHTHEFLKQVQNEKPYQWQRIMAGIFHLQHLYSKEIVEKACVRALDYKVISYTSVKNICKNNLYDKKEESLAVKCSNGFAHELTKYDSLIN